jgi:hypothetical protein
MAFSVATLTGAATAQAQISIGFSVNFAPPPLPVYEQPPIVEPDDIWIPGYWAWDDDDYDYYWVPGTWAEAPQPGLLWTPAWWGWSDGVYAFHDGYWADHIGYYGGVVYGHGYNGSGYEGGYWQNNHFFYNRTVNNITNVHITTVYSKTVIVEGSPTASFNGPGGATARPTPQQTQYAQERHVPPTSLQTQNVRAAAAVPELRASANHGAPPIAATARPAAFKGPDVVKAARAGGDYHPPEAAVQRQAQARAAHGDGAPPPSAASAHMDAAPPARTGGEVAAPPAKPEVRAAPTEKPAEDMAPPKPAEDRAPPKPAEDRSPPKPTGRPAPSKSAGPPHPAAQHAPPHEKAPAPHDDKRKDPQG